MRELLVQLGLQTYGTVQSTEFTSNEADAVVCIGQNADR